MERLGKSFLDYFKRADKFLWLVMLAISAYSLLLLKTVPSPAGRRSYFATQLIAILIGYIGAWLITLIDYRDLSNLWYIIAGFVVAYAGDIMTMPGLPKRPAAERIDVDASGKISGLF